MTKRNITLDVAKGLGIIVVVMGHNWINAVNDEVSEVIYSFHMPLFFFLSGVLLKDSVHWRHFLLTRVDGLLKPYLVVLTSVGIIKCLAASSNETAGAYFLKYAIGMFWAIGPSIAWPPLWFLPHLFISALFTLSILKTLQGINKSLIALLFIAILLMGIHFIRAFWDANRLISPSAGLDFLNGLPWSADLVPVTSAFMAFGYLMRDHVNTMTLRLPILFAAISVFIALHVHFDVSMNLNRRDYGQPLISSLQAALGIYITLAVAVLLQRYTLLQKVLSYCGASTLFILLFHGFIQNRLFEALSTLSGHSYLNVALSAIFAIVGSILLWELTKKHKGLSFLLLSLRR